MARAITAGELTKLRSANQRSRLYLAIHTPATVFSARVNQSFFSTDRVTSVTYDGVTFGAYTDILPGMTVYVGSAAGLYDLGMCRVRKSPTGSVLYIGESGEIPWANDLYLTVVDEFGLWARHLITSGSTIRMDYDVSYSNQHAVCAPVPVMGPDMVVWLDGATVSVSPTAANSWVPGSTISSYSWSAPGASATANLTAAQPTITYNAAGVYRIACQVTSAEGAITTGYRRVFVFSSATMPVQAFTLQGCAGDAESGGWSFSVEMYDQAALSLVRDRAKVILFARDWYGNTEGRIGPVAGAENVICAGWIAGEEIVWKPETGSATFTVHGPAHWLGKVDAFPTGLRHVSSAPTTWLQMQNLTVDKTLWHLWTWRSTASIVMDCYPSSDTRLATALEAPAGSLWMQMQTIAQQSILARPLCDRYGRLFVETDTQYLATADRSAIPVVMDITRADWDADEGVRIERRTAGEVSRVELSGIYYNATTSQPLFSHAPGKTMGRFGAVESLDRMLLSGQTGANTLAGNVLAQRNNPYPAVDILLAENNRMIDICPRQYVTLTIAAADTERGITWTAQKLIPRRVGFEHDAESGALLTSLECEAETIGTAGVTVIMPKPNIPGNADYGFQVPDFEGWKSWPNPLPPGFGFLPDTYPPAPQIPSGSAGACTTDSPANGPYSVPIVGLFEAGIRYSATGTMQCVVRTSSHTNQTTYTLYGTFEKYVGSAWEETTDDSFYSVEALAADGTVIATGVHDAVVDPRFRTGKLNAVTATDIAYIRISLTVDLLRPTAVYKSSSSGHFWWPISNAGTLTWGYTGSGLWASLTGVEIEGVTTTWSFDYSIGCSIQIGAGTEFPSGTSFVFKQYGFAKIESTGNRGHLKLSHRGGFYSGTPYWSEPMAGTEFFNFSDEYTLTATTSTGYRALLLETFANVLVPTNTSWFKASINNYVEVHLKPTYRMNLEQVNIYNVCPIVVS